MKTRLIALLAAACLLLAACGAPQAQAPDDADSSAPASSASPSVPEKGDPTLPRREDEPNFVTLPAPSLAGNLIGEDAEQKVGICLPPGYTGSGQDYPVLYHLTGYTEDYILRAHSYHGILADLYAADAIEPMIVVVVNGANRMGGGWYANSPVSGNWEDYVAEDLPAFIDENYRTIASPEARCLVGHSMGGAGMLHLTMRRPGIYGYGYAFNPAILATGALEEFGPGFDLLEHVALGFEGDDKEALAERYVYTLDTLDGGFFWPLAYASAFGYDTAQNPPYVALPEKDEDGRWMEDAVWQRYEDGIGGWPGKVARHADALKQLGWLVIDLGERDELAWIPPACHQLSEELDKQGVPHELISHDGTHGSRVEQQIQEVLLPKFSQSVRNL